MEDKNKIANGDLDLKQITEKARVFSDLLGKINTVDPKKKLLWSEIYRNAVYDRNSAYLLFNELHTIMGMSIGDQTMAANSLTKYLDKINKANDQLLKLAELLAKEESDSQVINSDDVYDQIGEGG